MRTLIDTDILLYKAAISAEQEINWGEGIWSLFTDIADAKKSFTYQFDKIKEATKTTEATFCLTDYKSNFRKSIDPTYKSNRKGTRKPVGYMALYDWVRNTFDTVVMPSIEADDCLGIIASSPENVGKCIIVSDDKDLLSVPSQVYRPSTNQHITVTEADADRFFLTQCLTGDSVDGYAGVKGIGPKSAEKILGSRPEWSLVENAFIKAGYTKEQALNQARLARILRWQDWDADKEEPILWTPPHYT